MFRRLAAVGVAVLFILALTATAASAHAALVNTSPSQSQQFVAGSPPSTVTVTFDDDVTTNARSIGVYDGSGHAMKVALLHTADEKVVKAQLPKLPDGGYAVVWHIVSDDGHPETGAFTFSVGAAGASTANLKSLEASRTSGRGIGIAFGIDRGIEFFACLVLVGGLVFARWRWPSALARRGVRAMLVVVAAVGFVTALASISLQAAYSNGGGTRSLFDGSALSDVVHARFGEAALLRAGLLVLLGGYVFAAFARRRVVRVAAETPLALLGLGVGATFAYAGHGFTGRWRGFAFVLDVTHLSAAAIWLGGLVLLAWALRKSIGPPAETQALQRFSQLALPAVALIVVSGTLQCWRQIGTWSGLWHTSYGRLLIVKVLVVLAIVVLASAGRDALRDRRRSGPEVVELPDGDGSAPHRLGNPGALTGGGMATVALDLEAATEVGMLDADTHEGVVRDVRRGMLLEAGLAVIVVGITSALVVTPPSREVEAAAKVPQAQTENVAATGKTIAYAVAVQPTLVGQNTIVVNPRLIAGPALLPTSLSGTAQYAGTGPATRLSFTALADGRWVAVGNLTRPGSWTVRLTGSTPSASEATTFQITVR
jgi:copper transport protein